MVDKVASREVQYYIKENENADEKTLILKHKTILGLPTSVIADQIRGRRKAKEKLPTLYKTAGIVYPKGLNLEQSSSEATAQLKTEIISKLKGNKNSCADLTGGFGIDSLFFSKLFKRVDYVEPNVDLHQIVRHNHNRLGANKIDYFETTAEQFLEESTNSYDLIFIDPSRRDKGNKKIFRFSECLPDVTQLTNQIFSKTNYLLIKASPLIDITQGLSELKNVAAVYVISVYNECKEVLFLCSTLNKNEPILHAINIEAKGSQDFSFTYSQEQNGIVPFSEPLSYVYEPNASILKAGAFKLIALKFGLFKIHPNTHLYTGNELTLDFPGRIFKSLASEKPNAKMMKSYFPEGKTNVIARNYPLNPEALRKKMKLKDGGSTYLLAFSSRKKKHTLVCQRIK